MRTSPGRDLASLPAWVQIGLVLLLAVVLRLGWDLVAHWDEMHSGGGLGFGLLLGLRGAAVAAGVWALWLAAFWKTGLPSDLSARQLLAAGARAVAGIMLTAIAVASLVHLVAELGDDRFAVRSAFRSGLLLAASGWVLALLLAPRRTITAPRRSARLAGVVVVNVFVSLLALEAVVLIFTRAHPTRLLWNEQSTRSTIEANQFRPGTPYLGFTANSGGYYDDEFFSAAAGDFVVAVVADSFGVGIVPHRQNFTTVAERILAERLQIAGRIAVHNFGVSSVGLPEYAWLLENEVPTTAPSRIVVGLFVGNDITGLASRREPGYYSLQQFQLFELGRRLFVLGRASRRAGEQVGRRAPDGGWRALNRAGGTFDQDTFLQIERAAVWAAHTRNRQIEELYRAAFAWLSRLHRQAGDKLLVVLIPDEYQVNDELYDELMQRAQDPTAYDRPYPQKRVGGFCRQQGIEVLDLLGPLARAEAKQPVYRLRDTHWNARGNRVAGEAIAAYLIERLEDRQTAPRAPAESG